MTTNPTRVPAHARQFAVIGYVGLGLFAVWHWLNPSSNDALLTAVTIGLFVLGVAPTLAWVKSGAERYPIPEILLLTTIPFYATPILTEHGTLSDYPADVVQRSALAVLYFQAAVIGGMAFACRLYRAPRKRGLWTEEIIPEENLHFTVHALTAFTVYLLISGFTKWIPGEWFGTFRAVFTGIGMVAVFVQARFWGAGTLPRNHRLLMLANVIVQIILQIMSLMLISGIIFLLIALLGYFTTARKVPWIPLVLLIPILAILHNGKGRMREIYWGPQASPVGLTDMPGFFVEWIGYGLQAAPENEEEEDAPATLKLMRRASLFQIVCVAVDVTPHRRPFLEGASYDNLAAQLVPRAVWPNKPKPAESVKLLSIQLGLQTVEEAEITSIGFGMVSEAYANYGYLGEVLLGLLLGAGLALAALSTAWAPTFSLGGIFRILCLAWCLNAESPLVVWTSSLYQACTALFAVLIAYKALAK